MSRPASSSPERVAAPAPQSRRVLFAWAVLGAALCVAALSVGGYELATAVTGRYEPVTAGQVWFGLHVGSLNLVQAVVQRYIHPGLWDPIITFFLSWPLWSLLGGPGVALVMLFPSRRR